MYLFILFINSSTGNSFLLGQAFTICVFRVQSNPPPPPTTQIVKICESLGQQNLFSSGIINKKYKQIRTTEVPYF